MNEIVTQGGNGPRRTSDQRLAKHAVMFAVAFIFWLLMAWPVAPSGGHLLWGDVAVGVIVAGLVSLVSRELVTQRFGRLLEPARYFWAVVYLFVFTWFVVRANLDVAYRVLHPAMPIRPGIVRVSTTLGTASGRTLLANSITLTPGTLTMDIDEDGTFYIHWINIPTADRQAAAQRIVDRFEWFIQRILE